MAVNPKDKPTRLVSFKRRVVTFVTDLYLVYSMMSGKGKTKK